MNKQQAEGKWEQFKASIKSKYAEFTEDELLQIEANSQKLVGYLQDKYGMTKDEASKEASKLEKGL